MQVFISHSSHDKPIARHICDELKTRGIKVWLDEAEIRVGQSIPEEIGKAIGVADICCILISRASSLSPWVNRELNAFLPKMLAKGGAVLPCRLDDSLCPDLIADIKYADFSVSFEDGIKSLLDAVAIREAVAADEDIKRRKADLLKSLTPGELLFFVHRFQRSRSYMIQDYTDTPAPWNALEKLETHGVLERIEDKYEVLFYITALGERLLDAVAYLVPEAELIKLDYGETPRDPQRVRRKVPDV